MTSSSGKKNKGGTAGGMFNFQQMMNDYYSYEPEEGSDAASKKRLFQESMIQSAFDAQMAKAADTRAAEFELTAARDLANLQQLNTRQQMQDQFTQGMTRMAEEYKMQSRFAVDEASRDMNKMSLAGDIQQNQTRLEGMEARKNINAQADATLKITGGTMMDRDAQAQRSAMEQLKQAGVNDQTLQKLVNDGAIQQITASGIQQRGLQEMLGEQALQSIAAQGNVDMAKLGSAAEANIKQALATTGGTTREAQKDVLESTEKQIGLKGEEDRKTLKDQAMAQGGKDVMEIGTIGATGIQERANIDAQKDANIAVIGAQQEANVADRGGTEMARDKQSQDAAESLTRVTGDEQRQTIGAQGDVDIRKIGASGDEAVRQIGAQGDQNVRQIGAQGDDTRKTMNEANRLEAKTRASQSGYARRLAGMF